MTSEQCIINRLQNWKQQRLASPTSQQAPHLEEDTLYRLSGPEGWKTVAEEDRAHLSRCPACLELWARWCRSRSTESSEQDETGGLVIGFGYQQAAASTAELEVASQRSSCGRFALNILPPQDSSGKTLVAIEVLDEHLRPAESARVSLYDCNNRCVLKGSLQEGRLARTISTLDGFDLSSWSIVIDNRTEETA